MVYYERVPTTEDLVEPEDACPDCGERRVDYLVWGEDGTWVKCAFCGCKYMPAVQAGVK